MEDYLIGVCKNSGIQFKYDPEDDDLISSHNWWSQKSGGVFTQINGKTTPLSYLILGLEKFSGKILKRNKDYYDYRKSNLFYGNIFELKGDCYEVECYDGQKFIVDKDSYEIVGKYVWHVDTNRYAITKLKNGRIIKLHRLLLGVVDDNSVEVDHINRDTLDNRMSNIRIADRSLNCYNRDLTKYNKSGKIGVYKMTDYNKWCVQINVGGERIYLGSYDDFDEAVKVREEAERKYYS